MTWIADAGLWIAVALAGLVAGMLAPWSRPDGRRPAFLENLVLAAAAAAVASLCARAGQVLGGPLSSGWLGAYLPVDTGPVARLAVLWATLPGSALTSATILLVWMAMSPDARAARSRHAFVMAVASLCLLGLSAWFIPGPGPALVIPPFGQSVPAAIAPLMAVIAATVLGWALSRALAARSDVRTELYVAWFFATGAIVAEQVARSSLGIGPRDPLVLGSASSGLVLWLLASVLIHDGLRERLLRVPRPAVGSRVGGMLAHAGAACVVVSFALHAVAARSNVVLPAGQAVAVTDAFRKSWHLVNQGVSRFDDAGAEVTSLSIEVRSPGGATSLLAPQVREYHGMDGQHLENAIVRRASTRGAVQTLRVLFTEADSLDAGRVRVTFLPLPILWPVGVLLLVASAVAGLSARPSSVSTS